jgi:hypothetical protein
MNKLYEWELDILLKLAYEKWELTGKEKYLDLVYKLRKMIREV